MIENIIVGKVSYSQLNTFSKCQRKWFFNRTHSFQKNISFMFGSAYHEALNSLKNKGVFESISDGIKYLKDNEFLELLKKEYSNEFYSEEQIEELSISEFQKYEELLEVMVIRYRKFLDENRFNIYMSELEVNFIVDKNIRLQAFFDRILERDGRYYLCEDKSNRDVNLSNVPIDFQSGIYITIADKVLDIPIEGLIYTKNKKSIEKQPKILKSGLLSTDASQGCTYDDYMMVAEQIYGVDTIPEANLICAEYLLNKNPFFAFSIINKNNNQKKSIMNQIKIKGKELVRFQKMMVKNQNKTFNKCCANYSADCSNMCDYYEQCLKADKE